MAAQKRNYHLQQHNMYLEERHRAMQTSIQDESYRHKWQLSLIKPRVGRLESGLDTTRSAFQNLSLDVELLSNMYRASVKHIEMASARNAELERERDTVTEKLGREVKSVVSLRRELKRKEQIILQVMSARRKGIADQQRLSAEIARLKDSLSDANKSTAERGRERDKLRKSMESERDKHEETRARLTELEVLARKQADEIRRYQAEKIALEAAGQKEDEDREDLAQMKLELEDTKEKLQQAVKSQSMLENMLAKAEERNEALEQELGGF